MKAIALKHLLHCVCLMLLVPVTAYSNAGKPTDSLFRNLFVANNRPEVHTHKPVKQEAVVSIPIRPQKIYDFSGALIYEGGPGRWVTNLFDGFASHDPKGNNMSYLDNAGSSTGMIPYRGNYVKQGKDDMGNLYRGNRGWLMMFDMTGDKDMFKLAKFNITDIYGLQHGGDYQDTMFFYNGDKIFEAPVEKRPMMLARPDSLLKPFAKLVTGAAINWRPEWCGVNNLTDSMRYILVRIYPKSRGFYNSYPDFSELVFYGNKRFNDAQINFRSPVYTGPLPAVKPLGNMVGTNNAGVFDDELGYEGLVRDYQGLSMYDDEESVLLDYPNNKYNFNHYNFATDLWNHHKVLFPESRGAMYWSSIRAGSKRLEAQLRKLENNPNINSMRLMNVTRPYMEPEDPWSYQADGDFFRHYAKIFGHDGSTTNLSTYRFHNTSLLPGPIVGKKIYNMVENGNEDEANLNSSILAYVVRSLVDYDGWENRIPNCGIKNGDPNFQLIYSGSVFLDSNRVSCSIFLSRLLRSDRKVIWDYFNAHHYSRTNNLLDHSPTYEEMVGVKGESPEKDNLYARLVAHRNHLYNELDGDTSKGFLLSEFGYDNWSTPSKSVSDLSFGPPYYALWTVSGTPTIPTYDSVRSKGIMMARAESIIAATGIGGSSEFTMMNVNYRPDNNTPGLFATCGRGGGGVYLPVKFPNYWSRASFWNLLKDYKVDSIISLGENKCVLRWRHVNKRDSVCYEIWKGSYDGSSIPNVEVKLGNVYPLVRKGMLSFTDPIPGSTDITLTSSTLAVTAKEEPAFYFVQEKSAANQLPVAKAGADQHIQLPVNSTMISGKDSYDQDGGITSYTWTKISGPVGGMITSVNNETTTISSLQAGTYVFQLMVTDGTGASAYDQVSIHVVDATKGPVAAAGQDITILPDGFGFLNGTGSSVADGRTMNSTVWTRVSGPSQYYMTSPNSIGTFLKHVTAGAYTFRLTVTDDLGISDFDDVQVTVSDPVTPPPPSGIPPVAHAGDDVTMLSSSFGFLNGSKSASAPETTIAQTVWTKVSGPEQYYMTSPNDIGTFLKHMLVGTYVFRLTVTDSRGISAFDDVVVQVVTGTGTRSSDNASSLNEVGIEMQPGLSLYPNPANNDLNVKWTSPYTGKATIYIYDVTGRRVESIDIKKETVGYTSKMNISHLGQGMYYLEINIPGFKTHVGKMFMK